MRSYSMTVYNENELGRALRNEEDYIEIQGDFVSDIRKIKAINRVMWCLVLSVLALIIATLLLAPVTAGTAPIAASLVAGTPAIGILGLSGCVTAIRIAVAGGGIHILKRLRRYRSKPMGKNWIILFK